MNKHMETLVCPQCEAGLFPVQNSSNKVDKEKLACLTCKKLCTITEAEEFRDAGIEFIEGKSFGRLHRRLASLLLDGHTVAMYKASRAQMAVALQDLLDIGFDKVFEHLLDTTESVVAEGEDSAEVINLSTMRNKHGV